ncbi:hypothetical protein BD410DRAFT_790896 [Rickenella mellea]|uniref:Arrestin-like N-terminal domain-containing protein n=1 Tax=Rickenella mellea TaxID=50990 RepID=A0A4Y7PYD4_9AGAM|nr:hypothetical protein BD410DRAFT_790896 [Rickenella mellea]
MESKTIFQHRETLWNISFGDPRAPAPRQPGQPLEPQVLLGHYTWTFSFSIPRYCIPIGFQRAGESQTHKLPPSLSDGDGHISYAIGVKVKRNTTFQPIHRLTTPFDYTPRSEPGAFSSLRQVAYRENTPLLGPDIDPEGWNVFPSVEVSGYDHHKFGRLKCSCTFALATPLSYTRGSVIPVMLMMESEDEKIFGAGLLSKSFFPQVKFSRTLRGRPDEVLATWSVANAQHVPSPCRRVLYGEIKVPRELRPSFDFGPVYIKYMVGTSMFASGAFIPDKEATLFQAEVEIVTDYAPGPRPIRYHESQRDTLDDGRLATRQS